VSYFQEASWRLLKIAVVHAFHKQLDLFGLRNKRGFRTGTTVTMLATSVISSYSGRFDKVDYLA
jgi:hypothetical protein